MGFLQALIGFVGGFVLFVWLMWRVFVVCGVARCLVFDRRFDVYVFAVFDLAWGFIFCHSWSLILGVRVFILFLGLARVGSRWRGVCCDGCYGGRGGCEVRFCE